MRRGKKAIPLRLSWTNPSSSWSTGVGQITGSKVAAAFRNARSIPTAGNQRPPIVLQATPVPAALLTLDLPTYRRRPSDRFHSQNTINRGRTIASSLALDIQSGEQNMQSVKASAAVAFVFVGLMLT